MFDNIALGMFKVLSVLFLILFALLPYNLVAQEVNANLKNESIPLNGIYTISIKVTGAELKNYSGFPEIQGFYKKGITSTNTVNEDDPEGFEVIVLEQSYTPLREGRFTVPAFNFTVNGKVKKISGASITVTSAVNSNNTTLTEFEAANNQPDEELLELVTTNKNKPFLQIIPSKKQIYQGEAVIVKLCFYLPDNYQNEVQFFKLSEQIPKIIAAFRTTSCWETDFQLNEVQSRKITLNKKRYTEYKIYQSAFYPFNDKPIDFRPVAMQFSVLKEIGKAGPFGVKTKEIIETYNAPAQRIFVKPLPKHPLMAVVPVGEFTFKEAIARNKVVTGQSIRYEFEVSGNGYQGSIQPPTTIESTLLDVFPPRISQSINKSESALRVKKKFTFEMVPLKADTFKLDQFFNFVYFSPAREAYDTLFSEISLFTTGITIEKKITKSSLTYWYSDIIAQSSSEETLLFSENNNRYYFNIALAVILAFGIAIIVWRRKV